MSGFFTFLSPRNVIDPGRKLFGAPSRRTFPEKNNRRRIIEARNKGARRGDIHSVGIRAAGFGLMLRDYNTAGEAHALIRDVIEIEFLFRFHTVSSGLDFYNLSAELDMLRIDDGGEFGPEEFAVVKR